MYVCWEKNYRKILIEHAKILYHSKIIWNMYIICNNVIFGILWFIGKSSLVSAIYESPNSKNPHNIWPISVGPIYELLLQYKYIWMELGLWILILLEILPMS